MNFAHSEVATLDPNTMRTLCEEYVANNYIDPETSERLGVKRGLRTPDGTGVLAGLTNVCDVVGYKKDQEGHVIPTPGKLIYRGVNINEIVDEAYRNDRFVFEEVIWLLLFGSLPTREQLDDFCEILAEHRALPEGFMDTMNAPSPNIMNKLQRCVLGLYSYDEHAEDLSLENILNQSINLIASMPTMMVNAYQMKRRYYDKQSMFFHLPKPGQSTAEHIPAPTVRIRSSPMRKQSCWICACWCTPTTAAATAPPLPPVCCPLPARILIPLLQRPSVH